jgi:4-amino-4-deoxy-L-arabinose transferase-like glycosyltransferase
MLSFTRNRAALHGYMRRLGPLNKLNISSIDSRFIAAYALVLIAVAWATPLRVPEIAAIAWSANYHWTGFWHWASQALDPSPLGYSIQFPFVLLFGATRLGARMPAILFAVGSCLLFLRLARRAVPKQRHAALLLFMLLPLQLLAVLSVPQYEAATFFVLLAITVFFDLAAQPGYKTAIIFALIIVACLYADWYAALPAFGAVLFLLRFSARPQQRKAAWFALGSCIVGAFSYAPYYILAHLRADPSWPTEQGLSLNTFGDMTALEWAVAVGVLFILAGVIAGAYVSFHLPVAQTTRRIVLFCLFGSVMMTLALIVAISLYMQYALPIRDLLYAAPGAALLFVAGVDWFVQRSAFRVPAAAVGVTVLLVCGIADLQWVFSPKENLALESRYIAPELTGDSCVVFVSDGYSRSLFVTFQPQLASRECQNFVRHRIVLASHAYVRPDQQAEAEGYFRGLNYSVVKRIRSGGGEIVVEQSN